MVTFLRSKLYLNFWVFILKCALTVGLLSAVDIVVLTLFSHGGATDVFSMALAYFFYASLIGFIIGIPSFILMVMVLRWRPKQSLTSLALGCGVGAGALTLLWYDQLGHPGFMDLIYFLLVPMLVALIAFVHFTKKHLNEEARSPTLPASVHGIF